MQNVYVLEGHRGAVVSGGATCWSRSKVFVAEPLPEKPIPFSLIRSDELVLMYLIKTEEMKHNNGMVV